MNPLGRAMADPTRSRILVNLLDAIEAWRGDKDDDERGWRPSCVPSPEKHPGRAVEVVSARDLVAECVRVPRDDRERRPDRGGVFQLLYSQPGVQRLFGVHG